MNILVAYYSETGNTRRVAEAIHAAIRHTRKELLPIDQVKETDSYDLVFCGFPVHNHSLPAKMVHFLERLPQGKKLAIFATHGSLRGGEKAVGAFYAAISLARGQTILGTFGCRGQVKFQLLDEWVESPQHRAWAIEAQSANGHPDAADLEEASTFAETMMYAAEHIHGPAKKG
jgi:flavodoxin I